MERVLELIFKRGDGKTMKLSLDDPREGISSQEIEAAMALVVDKDPFNVEGGLAEALSANIITTETQEVYKAL